MYSDRKPTAAVQKKKKSTIKMMTLLIARQINIISNKRKIVYFSLEIIFQAQ